MTSDRDTFAAAALAGLLAQGDDGSFSEESYARAAYRWADAMLRERDRTNHDAAPAARARTDADRGRTDKADSQLGEGTGDTPETQTTPGACSVPSEGTEPVAWDGVAKNVHPPCQDFPQKNLTLTDAEREAVEASREFWQVESEAFSAPKDQHYAATLRGLLERTARAAT